MLRLRDRNAADEVASAVRHAGQRALVLQTDTTEERSVVELFDRARAFGTLTGLVNNAGSASAIGSLEGVTSNLEMETLPHLTAMTDEAKASLRAVKRTAHSLSDRPQSILFGSPNGQPGPGEPGFTAPAK